MVGAGLEWHRQAENTAWANELATLREIFGPVTAKAHGVGVDQRRDVAEGQPLSGLGRSLAVDSRGSRPTPGSRTGDDHRFRSGTRRGYQIRPLV